MAKKSKDEQKKRPEELDFSSLAGIETADKGEILNQVQDDAPEETKTEKKTAKKGRARSKKYTEKRALVDKTKAYTPAEAVALVKTLSYTKFDGTVEAHLQVKEAGISATLTFPHSTGRSVRVAVVNEEVLDQINKGVIDFDILVARPEDMKNLAKFARVLGPKGLMPNPKNGTVTPNPDKKKKELEAGAITLKTEKKAPLVHTIIGKVSMDDKALTENLEALLKAFVNKSVRLYITASMSPSVRVMV